VIKNGCELTAAVILLVTVALQKTKKNPDRCLPLAKARSLSKSERAATAKKKKREGSKGKTVVKNTKKATVKICFVAEKFVRK
jgi:hypothetical protein